MTSKIIKIRTAEAEKLAKKDKEATLVALDNLFMDIIKADIPLYLLKDKDVFLTLKKSEEDPRRFLQLFSKPNVLKEEHKHLNVVKIKALQLVQIAKASILEDVYGIILDYRAAISLNRFLTSFHLQILHESSEISEEFLNYISLVHMIRNNTIKKLVYVESEGNPWILHEGIEKSYILSDGNYDLPSETATTNPMQLDIFFHMRIPIEISTKELSFEITSREYLMESLSLLKITQSSTTYMPSLEFTDEPVEFLADFDYRSISDISIGPKKSVSTMTSGQIPQNSNEQLITEPSELNSKLDSRVDLTPEFSNMDTDIVVEPTNSKTVDIDTISKNLGHMLSRKNNKHDECSEEELSLEPQFTNPDLNFQSDGSLGTEESYCNDEIKNEFDYDYTRKEETAFIDQLSEQDSELCLDATIVDQAKTILEKEGFSTLPKDNVSRDEDEGKSSNFLKIPKEIVAKVKSKLVNKKKSSKEGRSDSPGDGEISDGNNEKKSKIPSTKIIGIVIIVVVIMLLMTIRPFILQGKNNEKEFWIYVNQKDYVTASELYLPSYDSGLQKEIDSMVAFYARDEISAETLVDFLRGIELIPNQSYAAQEAFEVARNLELSKNAYILGREETNVVEKLTFWTAVIPSDVNNYESVWESVGKNPWDDYLLELIETYSTADWTKSQEYTELAYFYYPDNENIKKWKYAHEQNETAPPLTHIPIKVRNLSIVPISSNNSIAILIAWENNDFQSIKEVSFLFSFWDSTGEKIYWEGNALYRGIEKPASVDGKFAPGYRSPDIWGWDNVWAGLGNQISSVSLEQVLIQYENGTTLAITQDVDLAKVLTG